MRAIYCIAVLLLNFFTLWGQSSPFKKGNSVFIQIDNEKEAREVNQYLSDELSRWGYWEVVTNRTNADIVLKLRIDTHGGITWTSWGGKSVILTAVIENKLGEVLWLSKKYKSSPNGSNGFSTARATVNKLVAGLKKDFGHG